MFDRYLGKLNFLSKGFVIKRVSYHVMFILTVISNINKRANTTINNILLDIDALQTPDNLYPAQKCMLSLLNISRIFMLLTTKLNK